MNPLIDVYPYQRWSDSFIRPGVVGSVGDVLVTPFLKTSSTDLPRRTERAFSGNNACHVGSNVQDGDEPNYLDAGLARTIDSNWDVPRRRRIQNGWVKMDIQAEDMMTEPFVSQLGDFSWRNQVARINDRFLTQAPPPGELSSGGIPRGGMVPRITDVAGV